MLFSCGLYFILPLRKAFSRFGCFQVDMCFLPAGIEPEVGFDGMDELASLLGAWTLKVHPEEFVGADLSLKDFPSNR